MSAEAPKPPTAMEGFKGWAAPKLNKARGFGGRIVDFGKFVTWPFGGLALKAMDWTMLKPLKGAYYVAETVKNAVPATFDATKKLVWGSAYALGYPFYKFLKTSLWDIPKMGFKMQWELPAAVLRTPGNLIKGVRSGISAVINAPMNVYDKVMDYKIFSSSSSHGAHAAAH